jgi:hypothetical protein
MIRTPIEETPFSLTFRTETIIPAEVGSPSFRVSHYNLGLNDEGNKKQHKSPEQSISNEQLTISTKR